MVCLQDVHWKYCPILGHFMILWSCKVYLRGSHLFFNLPTQSLLVADPFCKRGSVARMCMQMGWELAEMTDLQWRTCKTKTCEALGNLHAATPTMSWRHSDHAALALKDLIKDWCLCTSCCCLLVDLWHAFRYGCQAQGMISWWSAAGLHLAMKALDLDTVSVCAAD